MNHTQAPLTTGYTNQRQALPNVPNQAGQNGNTYVLPQTAPINGMSTYYPSPPINASINAQQFNGYPDAIGQNPVLSLPANSYVTKQPQDEYGIPRYNVVNFTGGHQQPGFSPSNQQFYLQPPQYQMPMSQSYMMGGQQSTASNTQYVGQIYPNNVHPTFQPSSQAQQQPQTTPTPQAPPAPRVRKRLTIINPVTGENVIEPEVPPAETPQPEVPELSSEDKEKQVYEDVNQRFRTAITGAVKDDDSKDESETTPHSTVRVIEQPAPASSAPPPSINVAEDQSIQAQIGFKSASVEPVIYNEVPIQYNNDINLTVERPSTPLTTIADREQQMDEEDIEKLLLLEQRAKTLYDSQVENIEQQIYSFEVLEMIHDIVKYYKKVPIPGDLELMKRKGLDIQSEIPQQLQNRSKYSNTSNAFNPGWNSNSQQVVGGIRKAYGGRHSFTDNKSGMPKRPPRGRISLDRPIKPPPPPVLDLRKADNAWKPKRRGEVELSEEEKKQQLLRKEVRSILNKITPTSYECLIEDFFNLDVAQDERSQEIAIELIFDKAVEEPKFCALYTSLCKAQIERGKGAKTKNSFYHTLILKVQSTFEGNSSFDATKAELSKQLENETDEKKKVDIEERLDMLKEKEKRYILGNIKFISHLYTVGYISDQVIAFCLSKLNSMFNATKDDIYVQYGIELLELVSKLYFSKDDNKDAKIASPNNVQSFVNWLSTDECKNNVSTKVRVMIMNFEDFKKAGYTKRNAEKGPKKLNELHDDIRKEEELKKNERLAYEAHKHKEDRFVNPARTPYNPRNSLDRKNTQEKRISAANASINTGTSTTTKKPPSLRAAFETTNTKQTKTSFFSSKAPAAEEGTSKSVGPEEKHDASWTVVNNKGGQDASRKSSSLERNK